MVEVRSGLKEGERVVTSGKFPDRRREQPANALQKLHGIVQMIARLIRWSAQHVRRRADRAPLWPYF